MNTDPTIWPPRPTGEVFPELLDTTLAAQLLLYDRHATPDNARRSVRALVKNAGLPSLGRIGSGLMFRKSDVITWLANRGGVDGTDPKVTVNAA